MEYIIDDIYGIQCTVEIMRYFEDDFNIKFVITDKLLGVGIVDRYIFFDIVKKEKYKIFKPVSYAHDLRMIKSYAIKFVYKFQNILHPKNKIPNQSFMDIIEDLDHVKHGYFKLNPLYKAHKTDNNNNHIPKIRPVISGNSSPLKPILKLIAEGCKMVNAKLQQLYNITNIIKDSFHAISLIDDYIKNRFEPTDIIITFDFVSFYTELPYEFIIDKLDFLIELFHNKYKNESDIVFKYLHQIVIMIKEGYIMTAKYCIIKIEDEFYTQKEGVLMGASCAPNLSGLSILTHMIQKKIYKASYIKLNIRAIDDTLMIYKNNMDIDFKDIFHQYYPKELKYTWKEMENNTIDFLDFSMIKLNNAIQYIMKIKVLKLEFFIPFKSNHPNHMKRNIIINMIHRAKILCSNDILFNSTLIALQKRFLKSGYPLMYLFRFFNNVKYNNRPQCIYKLNCKREKKKELMLKQNKVYYKPIWTMKNNISILYDKILDKYNNNQNRLFKHFKQKYPNKWITYKLNDSVQKVVRCKDATYKII